MNTLSCEDHCTKPIPRASLGSARETPGLGVVRDSIPPGHFIVIPGAVSSELLGELANYCENRLALQDVRVPPRPRQGKSLGSARHTYSEGKRQTYLRQRLAESAIARDRIAVPSEAASPQCASTESAISRPEETNKTSGDSDSDSDTLAEKEPVSGYARECKLAWFSGSRETPRLFQHLAELAQSGAREFPSIGSLPLGCVFEDCQVAEYGPGQHFSGWHRDGEKGRGEETDLSLLALVLMLSSNEDFQGGEFQVRLPASAAAEETLNGESKQACSRKRKLCEDTIEMTIQLRKGDVLLFPAQNLLHRVTPVSSGLRRTLIQWVIDPSDRAGRLGWNGRSSQLKFLKAFIFITRQADKTRRGARVCQRVKQWVVGLLLNKYSAEKLAAIEEHRVCRHLAALVRWATRDKWSLLLARRVADVLVTISTAVLEAHVDLLRHESFLAAQSSQLVVLSTHLLEKRLLPLIGLLLAHAGTDFQILATLGPFLSQLLTIANAHRAPNAEHWNTYVPLLPCTPELGVTLQCSASAAASAILLQMPSVLEYPEWFLHAQCPEKEMDRHLDFLRFRRDAVALLCSIGKLHEESMMDAARRATQWLMMEKTHSIAATCEESDQVWPVHVRRTEAVLHFLLLIGKQHVNHRHVLMICLSDVLATDGPRHWGVQLALLDLYSTFAQHWEASATHCSTKSTSLFSVIHDLCGTHGLRSQDRRLASRSSFVLLEVARRQRQYLACSVLSIYQSICDVLGSNSLPRDQTLHIYEMLGLLCDEEAALEQGIYVSNSIVNPLLAKLEVFTSDAASTEGLSDTPCDDIAWMINVCACMLLPPAETNNLVAPASCHRLRFLNVARNLTSGMSAEGKVQDSKEMKEAHSAALRVLRALQV